MSSKNTIKFTYLFPFRRYFFLLIYLNERFYQMKQQGKQNLIFSFNLFYLLLTSDDIDVKRLLIVCDICVLRLSGILLSYSRISLLVFWPVIRAVLALNHRISEAQVWPPTFLDRCSAPLEINLKGQHGGQA